MARNYLKSETYKGHEIKVYNRGARFMTSRYIAEYEDAKLQYNRQFTFYGGSRIEAVNKAKEDLDRNFIGRWMRNIAIGGFYFEQVIADDKGRTLVILTVSEVHSKVNYFEFRVYYFKTTNSIVDVTKKEFATYEEASRYAHNYMRTQKFKKVGAKKVIEV